MRAVCVAMVLGFVVGCGKPTPTTADAASGKPEPQIGDPKITDPRGDESKPLPKVEPKADEPAVYTGSPVPLVKDYLSNRIGADQKYLNKRVNITAAVNVINRTKSGEAYTGFVFVSDFGKVVEPSLIFVFPKDREASIANLKVNDTATIEGVCRGRVDDGVFRSIKGYEFHVRVDDCRLIATLGDKKK